MRIVSLCPSLTELVFDLGRGSDLVGVTEYCIHPADGVAKIDKVGGTKNPRLAQILELEPDMVLLNDEENRFEDAQALATAGVPCLSSLPRDPTETAEMVRSIGRAIDRTDEAEEIAQRIAQRCDQVRRMMVDQPPVSFAYLIWRKPWMTVNADTYAHSLLALAGGVNVFGDCRKRYPEISIQQLADSRPHLVLLGSEPFPFSHEHRQELASATDFPLTRFRLADGEFLSWHGSRTPDGITYAGDLLAAVRGDGLA